MDADTVFWGYMLESPWATLGAQYNAIQSWVMNRSMNRVPIAVGDRANQRGIHLFKRDQGQHLFAKVHRGDVVVMRDPEVVFGSADDCKETLMMAQGRGIKLAFANNPQNYALHRSDERKRLEKAIKRIKDIAARKLAKRHRSREKPPIGYRYPEGGMDLVPDGPTRALAALIRVLHQTYEMDYITMTKWINRMAGRGQHMKASRLHKAMVCDWPLVPPATLDAYAYRHHPHLNSQVTKVPHVNEATRKLIIEFLKTGFHTAREIAAHVNLSDITIGPLLQRRELRRNIVRDTTGRVTKYTWVTPSPRTSQPRSDEPLVEHLASDGLFQPGPDSPPILAEPVPPPGLEPTGTE